LAPEALYYCKTWPQPAAGGREGMNSFLYFILGTYYHYHKLVMSGITLFIFGLLSTIIAWLNIKYPGTFPFQVFGISLEYYMKLILYAISLLLFISALCISYMKSYPRRNELNVSRMTCRWAILNVDGDFASSIYYTIINRSNVSITDLRNEREGFHVDVDNLQVKYSTYGDTYKKSHYRVAILYGPTKYERDITSAGMTRKVYLWEWTATINPPLEPKQRINILRTLDVASCEKQAFSQDGTFWGYKIVYPTLRLEFIINAPPHHKIVYLEGYCSDETGTVVSSRPKPRLLHCDSVLEWRIYFPVRECRYSIRFRLEPECRYSENNEHV
jgi:hypothetical protein